MHRHRPFRFGVLAFGAASRQAFVALIRRERYGISYLSGFPEAIETIAPIIARLAGR